MSVLYCTIPHFATALARRDNAELKEGPLVLIGPEGRVLDASAQAAAGGVMPGMTARSAEVHCPQAHLVEAKVDRCQAKAEDLLQLLEENSPNVEAHGWGAAYVDLGNLARDQTDAVSLCRQVGRTVRKELGPSLQPALGWDNSKFTAQTAARRTKPGHLRAVDNAGEKAFLNPLPVSLLPLPGDTLQRLCFLGLRTLGQYAKLPSGAVQQQFGRSGILAHRCAQGKDDRPIVPRWQAVQLAASIEFESPLAEREQLVTVLRHLVSPLLVDLGTNLQACGQVCLVAHFDDGSSQEKNRTFLLPVSEEGRIVRALEQLLDRMDWRAPATGLDIDLQQLQDALVEQLVLFALPDETQVRESRQKLETVHGYLAGRFGTSALRRPALTQPGAPLPEWRVGWINKDEP